MEEKHFSERTNIMVGLVLAAICTSINLIALAAGLISHRTALQILAVNGFFFTLCQLFLTQWIEQQSDPVKKVPGRPLLSFNLGSLGMLMCLMMFGTVATIQLQVSVGVGYTLGLVYQTYLNEATNKLA